MKRTLITTIVLILALTIFSSCAAPAPSYSYYYRFGEQAVREDGLLETFSYLVETPENSNDGKEHYEGTGTYTVEIYADTQAAGGYSVKTMLEMTGSFVARDEAGAQLSIRDAFTDTIEGEADFKVTNDSFTVSRFKKTFFKHMLTVGGSVVKYHYSISGSYSGSNYSSTVQDLFDSGDGDFLSAETNKNRNFNTVLEGRYADNETFFLLLRLQNIDAAFKDSFYVAEPFNAVQPVKKWLVSNVSDSEKPIEYRLDGKDIDGASQEEYPDGVPCFSLKATLDDRNKGQDISMLFSREVKLRYAKTQGEIAMPNAYDTELQLLMEFVQEGIKFSLTEYKNYAHKA